MFNRSFFHLLMIYCDICPFECSERAEFVIRLYSFLHAFPLELRNSVIRELFDDAAEILNRTDSWERCFDCGCRNTQTVVCVICSRCTGSGGASPSAFGLPGDFFPNAAPRFICLDHALRQHCMSCATPLAASNYFIDPDSLNDAVT